MRYFGGYYVNANRSVSANQGAARVSGQALFDVFGSWKIFKATTIAGGIRNIFDKRPPIDVTRTTGYAPYGDPRLRSFYLSINQRL